jgi:hypothetical protein
LGDLPSESVTTPSHIPCLKLDSHKTILPKGKGNNAKDAGVYLFQGRLDPSFISKCLIAVKVSRRSWSNHHDCDEDGEGSVASSYGCVVPDCLKRSRKSQIRGNTWTLHCKIRLRLDATSPEGDAEQDRISK